MLTNEEKQSLLSNKYDIEHILQRKELSHSLLKLIINHVDIETSEMDDIFTVEDNIQAWSKLIEVLLEKEALFTDEIEEDSYSIDALSDYFQASIQTIEKWIKDGRFIGVGPDFDEYTQIAQDVLWIQSEDTQFSIQDIVENYKHNKLPPELSHEDTIMEIQVELEVLETKYNGKLDEVLRDKSLNSEEKKDLDAWNYFIGLWRMYTDEQNKL
ncbi:hypothetical protein [Bacillus massiliigorillae]|uniref:hypothetical protein n=1 Tax=Bacillus massiliigorillae TaxID=1243664 RepID=UPI00039D0BB9|nr:hypothetical protein [Bacillus massiliigorillae]